MKDIIELISNKIMWPEEYHDFSDKRNFFNIPNAINVLSNLAFLIPIIYLLRSNKKSQKINLLMVHILLLGITSSYYHYNPSDKTLFWDILMIATISMLVLNIITNNSNQSFVYLFGILSVLYWKYSGDMRLYLIILIGVPLYIVLKYYKNKKLRIYLLIMILSNIILRWSEHNDHFIYRTTNSKVSGHTIKHIFAGIGILSVIMILEKTKKI